MRINRVHHEVKRAATFCEAKNMEPGDDDPSETLMLYLGQSDTTIQMYAPYILYRLCSKTTLVQGCRNVL